MIFPVYNISVNICFLSIISLLDPCHYLSCDTEEMYGVSIISWYLLMAIHICIYARVFWVAHLFYQLVWFQCLCEWNEKIAIVCAIRTVSLLCFVLRGFIEREGHITENVRWIIAINPQMSLRLFWNLTRRDDEQHVSVRASLFWLMQHRRGGLLLNF